MIYYIGKIKVIHFDAPILKKKELLSGKMIPTVNIYPTYENVKYPFRIAWRFRVTDLKGNQLSSYLAESSFVIEDDGQPHDVTKLDRLIGDMYLNVEINWEERTRGTSLGGNTLGVFSTEQTVKMRELIIEMMSKDR